MIESDKKQFITSLKNLGTAFPKAPDFKDKDIARMWWGVLSHIPLESFTNACHHALKTLEWFPSPATLIRFCEEVYETDKQIGTDISARIEKAISTYGGYNHQDAEKFIGPIGWEVVGQTSCWWDICMLTDRDMPQARKRWAELGELVSQRFNRDGENKPAALPKSSSNVTAIETANRLLGKMK